MSKKLIAGSIATAVLASASIAYAETTSVTAASNVSEIAKLLEQVKTLQNQIAELQKKQGELRVEVQSALRLAGDLRLGMSNEDVKLLQEMLAADPDIYPEGIVTGYYGPLTAKAVAKFQAKHGLESVGNVGPKTLAKLNGLLNDHDFKCKAWGKLIATGQVKKHGNAEIDLSKCYVIPAGIDKKLGVDWKKATTTKATTTTDIKAPIIEDIDIDDVGSTTAEISWETNENAKGDLWYSTENDVDKNDSDTEHVSLASFDDEHEVDLTGLEPDTKYYFRITATDKSGNSKTTGIESFETKNTGSDDDDDEDDDD